VTAEFTARIKAAELIKAKTATKAAAAEAATATSKALETIKVASIETISSTHYIYLRGFTISFLVLLYSLFILSILISYWKE
jgi:hypothetical protein